MTAPFGHELIELGLVLGEPSLDQGAGDLVIWHQALPHGASPNRANRPRVVQYINMFPTQYEEHEEWI